jgi:exopolysaccharide biosynthesis polyprenyl glycosylphosphotransferase
VTHAFSLIAILYFWAGTTASMLGVRAVLRALRARAPETHDVLIIGSGPRALSLYHELCGDGVQGYRCLGFVDSPAGEMVPDVATRLLGDLAGLEQILMRQAIDEVLIALPVRSCYAEIQRAIEICTRGGVPARYLADVFQHRSHVGSDPAMESLTAVSVGVSSDDGRLFVKRFIDLALGGFALVITFPVLACAALAIKLTSPGSILFAQERYGLNKRRFKMYKLRTMVADAEEQQVRLESYNEATGPVFKIRQDPRITPVGRFLRRLSIDELPQLINVIRGEMSLVGPRPLPLRDVSRFGEPALMRRFSVYPGITGLWQVSGRSELGFDDWINLDLKYIDEWSLELDLRILLRTIPTVIHGRGAV